MRGIWITRSDPTCPSLIGINERHLFQASTTIAISAARSAAPAHRKNLGSPEFYPLYEEAQRLNTPVTIHAFGGDEPGSEVFDQFICLHTTGHPFPVLRQLTAMVFGGIPEMFPKLRG